MTWVLSVALLVGAATVAEADPCNLRALVEAPSAALRPRLESSSGRARACLSVVLAQALARDGDVAAAAQLLDDAAVALPELAPSLVRARARVTSRPTAGSAFSTAPRNEAEAAEMVSGLLRAARPRAAARLALEFPRGPTPHEALELATITALVRADRIDDALAHARGLPATDAFRRIQAWALSKGGRHDEARDLYAALAAATTDEALAAEATFYAAFAAYEHGALEDARARFAAGLSATQGTSFDAATRWYLALCDILLGRFADAALTLEALVRALPADREVLKHRYWLARSRIATGDGAARTQGMAELAALAAQDPIDFYGLLARRRLGRPPIRGVRVARDAVAQRARSDEQARIPLLLWWLGLDEEAREAARALGSKLEDIGVQHVVADAHHGWRRGARFIPFPRTSAGSLVQDASWRVSFAAPWSDVVDGAAARHGVPSSFLYAIMRTESGFAADAVSPAGARGVIQLMPAVARGMCTATGRPATDADRAFDPQMSIDLGAALLGRLQTEFGSRMLAAAAYNGGAPSVVRWLHLHGTLEPELFIERIPFKETRDYVKRVLATEATYRALDGADLTLDLPDAVPPPPSAVTDFPNME